VVRARGLRKNFSFSFSMAAGPGSLGTQQPWLLIFDRVCFMTIRDSGPF
jgi:hypothetical protein